MLCCEFLRDLLSLKIHKQYVKDDSPTDKLTFSSVSVKLTKPRVTLQLSVLCFDCFLLR